MKRPFFYSCLFFWFWVTLGGSFIFLLAVLILTFDGWCYMLICQCNFQFPLEDFQGWILVYEDKSLLKTVFFVFQNNSVTSIIYWSVICKATCGITHIRTAIGVGGCAFCWVSSTSFSCVRILWGDTELCCNAAYRLYWKVGFNQWRMPKVAEVLIKNWFVSIFCMCLSLGECLTLAWEVNSRNCQGCQRCWDAAQCRALQIPGLTVMGTTGHSSHMALLGTCLLEPQTFRARTFPPKTSPRRFSSARSSVIYQEFL